METQDHLNFKFKFVQNGQATGWFSTTASADAQSLKLGEEFIRYEYVVETTTRDNRVVLILQDGTGEVAGPKLEKNLNDGTIVLEIYGPKALTVERFIDRQASHVAAATRERALIAAGNGHMYRAVTCPHCTATVDLSELDKTTYIYCRFCESVVQEGGVITAGDKYRPCDECAMFDRVKGYTEFYFYFLLVIYGFSYNRRHLCDNCVGRLFWKVLLSNLIFVLGVPSALWMKMRSMQGRDPNLGELAKANRLALRGKMQDAEPLFIRLHERYPEHPGLLYDQAHGYLQAGDADQAIGCFDRSLRSCSNYLPTLQTLHAIQEAGQAADAADDFAGRID